MIPQDYSIRPLAVAVILQAARDASTDPAARDWLQHDAPLWLDACGIDLHPEKITRWIAKGCKIKNRGALHLGTPSPKNTKHRAGYTTRETVTGRERMPA